MRTRACKSLALLIRSRVGEPKIGCEIGVWRGQNARWMLAKFRDLILYCVDPWETGGSHQTLEATTEGFYAAKQEFYTTTDFAAARRRVLEMPNIEAANRIKDGSLDFFFLDAEHLYECVKQELPVWVPKLRMGGLACGHDYNAPHDKKGIFGVKRAVDEFAGKNGYAVHVVDGDIWWLEKIPDGI